MNEMVERGAKAMEAKRRELISQPLARIWPDLMRAAIEAMREQLPSQSESEDLGEIAHWIAAPMKDVGTFEQFQEVVDRAEHALRGRSQPAITPGQ
jgi:hypothetical protein